MPAIVFWRHRLAVGSDDLFWPFGGLLLLYTTWCIAYSVLLGLFASRLIAEDCAAGFLYLAFLVTGVVFSLLSANAAVGVMVVSVRGTILDDTPRKSMTKWLSVHGVLTMLEVAHSCVGVPMFFFADQAECMAGLPVLGTIGQAMICINLVAFFIFVMVLWSVLSPAKKKDAVEHSFWVKLWGTLFFRKNDEFEALANAASILSELFAFSTDLVPSDVLAGLILMQQRMVHTSKNILPPDHPPLKSDGYRLAPGVNTEELALASNYVRYAVAVYGWPLYLEMNLCNACRLVPRDCGCCWKNMSSQQYKHPVTGQVVYDSVGDNCCGANLAASLDMGRIPPDSLLFISFGNELFVSPFLIAVDHSTRALIISCRGSLSLRDAVVDINITPDRIPGMPTGWAHGGFLKVAHNVKRAIEETSILDRLQADGDLHGYNLVFVGHSLGAATATLLALLYRSQYPNLRCFAFSPPGCVLNKDAAKQCESFITSIVFHNDMAARLGRVQLERFKDEVLMLLHSCKRPKPFLVARSCLPSVTPDYDEESLLDKPLMIDDDAGHYGAAYQDAGASVDAALPQPARPMVDDRPVNDANGTATAIDGVLYGGPDGSSQPSTSYVPPMYAPGRILHIVKLQEKLAQSNMFAPSHTVYEVRVADRHDFHQLWISMDGLITHLPDRVETVLRLISSSI